VTLIEYFSHDQYLPCRETELLGYDNSRLLPEGDNFVSLKGKFELLHMYEGSMLVTQRGLFYLDPSACNLVQQLIEPKRVSKIITDTLIEKELERFYYYDLLSFDYSKNNVMIDYIVPKEIENIYSADVYGWFFYFPTRIELDLTNYCNLNCIHCSRDASIIRSNCELRKDQIERLISEAANIGVQSLQLMGGEPLLHDNFFEICEYAKQKGINRLDTSSNGWIIDKKNAVRISKYFDEIQLSIHGASEHMHDRIVNKSGAWKQILKAAKNLVDVGVNVKINMSILHENVCEIEAMADLARNIGATSLRYLALSNEGRGKNLRELTVNDRKSIGEKICQISDQESQRKSHLIIESGGFPPSKPVNRYAQFFGCPAGRELLYINAGGFVSSCGVIQEYIGNITTMSISELWHHELLRNLRKPLFCSCDFNTNCSGPCLANFTDPYKRDQFN